MYEFLGNNHIIQPYSSRNKGGLEGRDEFRQQGSESLDYDLSDYFVNCVAQIDRSKEARQLASRYFGMKVTRVSLK